MPGRENAHDQPLTGGGLGEGARQDPPYGRHRALGREFRRVPCGEPATRKALPDRHARRVAGGRGLTLLLVPPVFSLLLRRSYPEFSLLVAEYRKWVRSHRTPPPLTPSRPRGSRAFSRRALWPSYPRSAAWQHPQWRDPYDRRSGRSRPVAVEGPPFAPLSRWPGRSSSTPMTRRTGEENSFEVVVEPGSGTQATDGATELLVPLDEVFDPVREIVRRNRRGQAFAQ